MNLYHADSGWSTPDILAQTVGSMEANQQTSMLAQAWEQQRLDLCEYTICLHLSGILVIGDKGEKWLFAAMISSIRPEPLNDKDREPSDSSTPAHLQRGGDEAGRSGLTSQIPFLIQSHRFLWLCEISRSSDDDTPTCCQWRKLALCDMWSNHLNPKRPDGEIVRDSGRNTTLPFYRGAHFWSLIN